MHELFSASKEYSDGTDETIKENVPGNKKLRSIAIVYNE